MIIFKGFIKKDPCVNMSLFRSTVAPLNPNQVVREYYMNTQTNAITAGICFFRKADPLPNQQYITHDGAQYVLIKALPMSDEKHATGFQMFYIKSLFERAREKLNPFIDGDNLLATCELHNGVAFHIKPTPYAELAKGLPQ